MITVNNLVKSFAGAPVLKGVSVSVTPGDVTAIIGPSGSGKSTFLRCINGLERFDDGSVQVDDLMLTPQTDPRRDAQLLQSVRKRIGMVFQQFNLFPHLTVMQNLCEAPLRVLGDPTDQAEEEAMRLLQRVGLAAKKHAFPRHLSGGEMQRVAIARALIMRPKAILFDEPTSALDPIMAAEVLAVMTDLAGKGQTMIVVTHSMHFARSVAKAVHVFSEGRDVEWGPPQRVFEDPQHAVTRAFLRDFVRD